MSTLARKFLAAGVLLMFVAVGALAQQVTQWGNSLDANTRVGFRQQDGAYLDANPQLGGGGYNYRGGGGRRNMGMQHHRYQVMRSGTNRYNTPNNWGGGQRYRTTQSHTRYSYHGPRQNTSMGSSGGMRQQAPAQRVGGNRVNTRLYP